MQRCHFVADFSNRNRISKLTIELLSTVVVLAALRKQTANWNKRVTRSGSSHDTENKRRTSKGSLSLRSDETSSRLYDLGNIYVVIPVLGGCAKPNKTLPSKIHILFWFLYEHFHDLSEQDVLINMSKCKNIDRFQLSEEATALHRNAGTVSANSCDIRWNNRSFRRTY